MAEFIKGDVVVIPFPFSNLSQSKKRPALVLANMQGDDLILCQITSQSILDTYAIQLTDADFDDNSLKQISNVRPNKLFTADHKIVEYKVGHITAEKMKQVTERLVKILEAE